MTFKKAVAVMAAGVLCGCASKAADIQASYVSPVLYQNLTCDQLSLEAQNVSRRAAAAAGVQDRKAGQDAAVATVGIIIFWPALFFTSGDGMAAAEVARLKGEMDAVQSASTAKGCGIVFAKEPPKPKPQKASNPKQ